MTRMARILFVGLLFGLVVGMFYPIAYADPGDPEEMGNDIHHIYRPPWRERDEWQRDGGCGVNDYTQGCGAHVDINRWAIDLNKADDCGAPLRADRSGSARVIPWYQGAGYGNLVGITHLNSLGPPVDVESSWYAHVEDFPSDQPWDTVFVQGDYVGNCSNTGGEYYCHVHYQVNDEDEDPVMWSGYNSLNVWFGAWPDYGYDLQHLSDYNETRHASNNTGPGYGRPYTDTCPPEVPGGLCKDRGPEDEPKSWAIRTWARNLAAYTVDVGSTRASIQGPCGANRRWVKGCYFYWGDYYYTQNFVLDFLGLQFPLSITEGPTGEDSEDYGFAESSTANAYRVTKAMWKAYGRQCGSDYTYLLIGRPLNEEYALGFNLFGQDFERGYLLADRNDALNVYVHVYDDSNPRQLLCSQGAGTGGFYDWLDLDKEPCYDVSGSGVVNVVDVLEVARRMDTSETDPVNTVYPGFDYDDRYDLNRNGACNIVDTLLVAQQALVYDPGRVCK